MTSTFRLPPGERVCVGFSGGVDSVVLLDAMAGEGARPVTAVHVHHGLEPQCRSLGGFLPRFLRGARRAAFHRTGDGRSRGARRTGGRGAHAALRDLRRAAGALRGARASPRRPGRDGAAAAAARHGTEGHRRDARDAPAARKPRAPLSPVASIPRADLVVRAQHAWPASGSRTSRTSRPATTAISCATTWPRSSMPRFPGWRDAARAFRAPCGLGQRAPGRARAQGWGARCGTPRRSRDLPEARRANALRAFLAMNGLAMPSRRGWPTWRASSTALAAMRACASSTTASRSRAPARHRAHRMRTRPRHEPWRVLLARRGRPRARARARTGAFRARDGPGLAAALVRGGRMVLHAARRRREDPPRREARPTRTLKNLLQEHDVPELATRPLAAAFRGRAARLGSWRGNRRGIRLRGRERGPFAVLDGGGKSAAMLE